MKTVIATLVMALVSSAAMAQEKLVAEYSWQALADAGKLKTGAVVTLPDKSIALKIENTGTEPLVATVLVIEEPKITSDFYKLSGDVRYENVEGDGFLEMWNYFGDGGQYFSRTLGETGPMGKLRGTSDWRPFILPFNATGAKSRPTKLVFNVQLPSKGVVYLRSPLKLTEASSGAGAQPGAWWSDRAGRLAGAVFGGVIGCIGGVVGWLGAKGKARALVLGTIKGLIAFGSVAAIGGIAALVTQQPYGVWYPLVLIGALSVIIFPLCLRRCSERYREIELRRIISMDAA